MAEQLNEVHERCSQRTVDLLALQGPVAGDLRQVVSSIYIVEDFDRMAALWKAPLPLSEVVWWYG